MRCTDIHFKSFFFSSSTPRKESWPYFSFSPLISYWDFSLSKPNWKTEGKEAGWCAHIDQPFGRQSRMEKWESWSWDIKKRIWYNLTAKIIPDRVKGPYVKSTTLKLLKDNMRLSLYQGVWEHFFTKIPKTYIRKGRWMKLL